MKKIVFLCLTSILLLSSCIDEQLSGVYENTERGLYQTFEFKGKNTCTITDGFVGFPFSSSYERDGDIIRIRTDKSDLLLTVKNSQTLLGEGWAKGTYVKK